MDAEDETNALPGAQLDIARMPGHWLLARLGKRVLRPGGLELTREMLAALKINATDDVVELAPGLGTTTRIVLEERPASYVGIERDEAAVAATRRQLRTECYECRRGSASNTGLGDASASVVFGEAVLTMQTADQKVAIVREAFRVLKAGGRYAIHELALQPNGLTETEKALIQRDLSEVIRVGARPLTLDEWRAALEQAGFRVMAEGTAAMHLLEPARLVADEGLLGALRIARNMLLSASARKRVLAMRSVFRRHASRMCAVMLVAQKPQQGPATAGA